VSWSLKIGTPFVPRTDDPKDKPAQSANDLICSAAVYRNGGTNSDTHLCDDCLRIGVRAIKVEIDALLGDLDANSDKHAVIADLTQRLGESQFRHYSACFDHDRMQQRLQTLLALPELEGLAESEAVSMARWEANRPPLRKLAQ